MNSIIFRFFSLTFTMNFYTQELKLNLLPPDKLYCDFNYWSSLFTQDTVSYTHLRAHETDSYLVCRLLLEKKLIK